MQHCLPLSGLPVSVVDRARYFFCTYLCCRPLSSSRQTPGSQCGGVDTTPLLAAAEEDLSSAALMHHTTVALIPPDEAWAPIQSARALVRDRGLWRWPPHANLLYPFVAPRNFFSAAHALALASTRVEQFDVTLREFRIFAHSKRSATLWLHPEPSRPEALVQLQAALQAAIPQADTQTKQHGGVFTAHFTVGHFAGEAEALAARDAILAAPGLWPKDGLTFRVAAVDLMARDGPDGQFEPRWRVALGSGSTDGGGAPTPPRPFPRGEGYLHMPKTMPEFCVRDAGAGKAGKRARRGRAGRGHAHGHGQQSQPETQSTQRTPDGPGRAEPARADEPGAIPAE